MTTRTEHQLGSRFGRLVVLGPIEAPRRGFGACVEVQCDCGVRKLMRSRMLPRNKSCGCHRVEAIGAANRVNSLKHGGRYTPEYSIWKGIIGRCENPRDAAYSRYGGRGIKMCPRWRADFAAFRADMGLRPSPEYSIDRINNDGNYEPGNCRWATSSEQARNRRNPWIARMEKYVPKTHCKRGHPFDEQNTNLRPNRRRPDAPPTRLCATCRRAAEAAHRQRARRGVVA